MKEIQLRNTNKTTMVDDEDYEYLMQWKWRLTKNGYICRSFKLNGSRNYVRMHRLLLNAPPDRQVDHIDGNPLNNQKENLRLCTARENAWNRKSNKQYKGVFELKDGKNRKKPWRARIEINGTGKRGHTGRKRIQLGYYATPEEAALAYNEAAIKYHGEFAKLNKIEGLPQSSLPSGLEEGSPV